MTQELIAITKRGTEVTLQEIHEMYDVRAHFMRLKSSINPQEDFQNFAAEVKNAVNVYLYKNKQNCVKGSYIEAWHFEENKALQQKVLVIEGEYAFIHKEFQGKYLSKTIRNNRVWEFLKYPFKAKYVVGVVYPATYFMYTKHTLNHWSWLDKNIPADAQEVMQNYIDRHGLAKNDVFSGIKSMPTLPIHTTDKDIARMEKNPHYAHYLELNPSWQQGYGLLMLAKIDFSTTLLMLKKRILG